MTPPSTTRASSSSRSSAPVCPFCGAPRSWAGDPIFGFWEPCQCDQALAAAAAERDRERQAKQEELAQARLRRFKGAGIPSRWFEMADNIDAGSVSICNAALRGQGTWLIGDVGLGKTRAAMGAAMAYMDRRTISVGEGLSRLEVTLADVRCITEEDILEAAGSRFGKGPTDEAALAGFKECALLILDDLGKAKPTAWAVSQIFAVIDARYSSRLPLVVTSQYGPSDLIARLSEEGEAKTAKALVSRLCSMCDRKRMQGHDHRLAGDAHVARD